MSTISGSSCTLTPSASPIRWERVASRPGEGRAADVEVFHRRHADDGGGINGVLAVRDGSDVEDGIRLGQGVIAGVVAERAFVAQRLGRVNAAFDDEAALGKTVFNSGKMFSTLGQLGENEC